MRLLSSCAIAGEVRMAGAVPAADRAWWLTGSEGLLDCSVGAARCEAGTIGAEVHLPVGRLPRAVRFTSDGSLLMVLGKGEVKVCDLGEEDATPEIWPLDDDQVNDVASVDGRHLHLARPLAWPPLRSLDRATGRLVDRHPERGDVSTHRPQVAVAPDGRHVAFGYVFDGMEVFDLAADSSYLWPREAVTWSAERVTLSDHIARLEFSVGGQIRAVSQSLQHGPTVLRCGDLDGRGVQDHRLAGRLPHVSVDSGGRYAAAARRDAPTRVEIFDLKGGEVLDAIDVGGRVMAVALDGARGQLTIVHRHGLAIYAFAMPSPR